MESTAEKADEEVDDRYCLEAQAGVVVEALLGVIQRNEIDDVGKDCDHSAEDEENSERDGRSTGVNSAICQ